MIERHVIYDAEDAVCVAEFRRRDVYLHLTVRLWSKALMRKMLTMWPEVRRYLLAAGVKRVRTYTRRGTKRKWFAFVEHFGFVVKKTTKNWIILEVPHA